MQDAFDSRQIPSQSKIRNLREEERLLLSSLLSSAWAKDALGKTLSTSLVTDLQDGGMGSVRFVQSEARSLGKAVVEAEYTDSDGILVSIVVNVDTHGDLFEVDFWKVDFSPLRRYPTPSQVRLSTTS